MINLKLKKLEKNLGKKLRHNTYCVGIDTASTTGIAIVYVNDKLTKIETKIVKIPSLPKGTEDKSRKYEEVLENLLFMVRGIKSSLHPKSTKILVLENSFMKFNVWTYGYLKSFMGIIYAELHDMFDEILIIFPTAARKAVGFKSQLKKGSKRTEKKKEIMKWVSNVIETEIKNDNEADAIVLSLAGLIKND